jgi:PAT family acetyl-CoA transporter-like MFS transporter 1
MENNSEEKPNLKGDYGNVALLFVLYSFQGIIAGMTSSISILMQSRGASYQDQALFTLVTYPTSSNQSIIFSIERNLIYNFYF